MPELSGSPACQNFTPGRRSHPAEGMPTPPSFNDHHCPVTSAAANWAGGTRPQSASVDSPSQIFSPPQINVGICSKRSTVCGKRRKMPRSIAALGGTHPIRGRPRRRALEKLERARADLEWKEPPGSDLLAAVRHHAVQLLTQSKLKL